MCEGLVRPNRYPPKVFPNTKLSLVLEQKHFRKHFVQLQLSQKDSYHIFFTQKKFPKFWWSKHAKEHVYFA